MKKKQTELEKAQEVILKDKEKKEQLYIDKFNTLMEEMKKENIKFIITPEIRQKESGNEFEIINHVIIQAL